MVLNLIGESEDPCKLIGRQMDESKMLPMWTEQNAMLLLFLAYGSKTILCTLFKQYEAAIEEFRQVDRRFQQAGANRVFAPVHYKFGIALCHAHLGQFDAARRWYEIAVRDAQNPPRWEVGIDFWDLRLTLDLLQKEVEELL